MANVIKIEMNIVFPLSANITNANITCITNNLFIYFFFPAIKQNLLLEFVKKNKQAKYNFNFCKKEIAIFGCCIFIFFL